MSTVPVDEVVSRAKITPFHRLIIVLCSILMIVDGYDMISYGSVVTVLMDEWELTSVHAGWLGAAALFGMLIGGMFIAPLADRFGRRPVMIWCIIGSAVGSLGCALATGFLTLGLSRAFVGVSLGAMVPNFISLTGEIAPHRSRALLVCFVSSLYSAGGIIAALLAIYLIPSFGWSSVFYVSVGAIILAPIMYRLLPESPEFLARQPHRRTEFEHVMNRLAPDVPTDNIISVEQKTVPKAPVAEIFRNGNAFNTVLIWVVFAMTMLLSYGLNTWLPTLMTNAGYPLGSGLFNLIILNVGGLGGAMLAGLLSDRYGVKRVILFYFLFAAASLMLLGLHPGRLTLNLLLVVAGATTIGTLAVIHALAVEYYPSLVRSTGVGWAAGVGRIGAISGPVLGGALLGLNLPFQQNFLAVAIPGVIGALAIASIRMSKSASSRPPTEPSETTQETHFSSQRS